MIASWSADRTTHVKIVAVSLVAAAVVGLVGVSARVADPASGTARTLLATEEETPLVVAVHIPDPPAIPCRQQVWPNVDRHCLSWTAPRSGPAVVAGGATAKATARMPEAASVLLQVGRDAGNPTVRTQETALLAGSAVQPLASELQPMPQHRAMSESQSARRLAPPNDDGLLSRVRKVQRRTIDSARVAHRNDDLSDLPVRGFAGDTRHDVVRPTNAQDVYYYSARPLSRPQASTPFSSLPGMGR